MSKFKVTYSVKQKNPVTGQEYVNSMTSHISTVVEALNSTQAMAIVEAMNPNYEVHYTDLVE